MAMIGEEVGTMKDYSCFVRPESLVEGKEYFLKISQDGRSIPVYTQVTFIELTACPAVVIVQDGRKEKYRCNRDDLFQISKV